MHSLRFPLSFEHDNNRGKWKKGLLQRSNDHRKATGSTIKKTPWIKSSIDLKFFAKLYEGLLLKRIKLLNQCVLIIFTLAYWIREEKRSFLEVAKRCFCAWLQKSKCNIIIRLFKLQIELPPIRNVGFENAPKQAEDTISSE